MLLRDGPETVHGLVSHDRLLHRGERLEGRQQAVDVLLASHLRKPLGQVQVQGQEEIQMLFSHILSKVSVTNILLSKKHCSLLLISY